MDLLDKIDLYVNEEVPFLKKKAKDDKDSEEASQESKGFADPSTQDKAPDEEDDENDLDAEKKQKQLKKLAIKGVNYTPPYQAGL